MKRSLFSSPLGAATAVGGLAARALAVLRRLSAAIACASFVVSLMPASLADPAVDPQALLRLALEHVHDIHIAPYLQYDYTVDLTHKSRTKTYAYDVLERMSDHVGRFTGLTADGTYSDDVHVRKTLVSPGLFLNAVAEDASAGAVGYLPTIGRVVSVPYHATFAGQEPAGDCALADHLVLVPTSEPDLHPLRELWIDPASTRICRATLEKRVLIVSRERINVTVDLNPEQFVEHWHLAGKGHTILGTYSLAADGTFRDIRNVETADPKLFR